MSAGNGVVVVLKGGSRAHYADALMVDVHDGTLSIYTKAEDPIAQFTAWEGWYWAGGVGEAA